MENFQFYLIALVALVLGVILVKKFVGCMVRLAITIVIIIVLLGIYFMYFQ